MEAAQATPQQLQAKATLNANRARDRNAAAAPAPAAAPTEDLKGEAVRLTLDRVTFASGFTLYGIFIAWLIMNARSLGSMLKKTRLGVIRFNAKSVFDMLPNMQKMRPFSFTPVTGVIATGLINALVGAALILILIVAFIPAYIITNPLEATRIFGSAIVNLLF